MSVVYPVSRRTRRTTVRVRLCGQGSDGATGGASHVDSFLADFRGVGVIP
jgi:hypothetical protein